jgi:hypothetical protein
MKSALARMLVAYASGHKQVKQAVDGVLAKLSVGPEALSQPWAEPQHAGSKLSLSQHSYRRISKNLRQT